MHLGLGYDPSQSLGKQADNSPAISPWPVPSYQNLPIRSLYKCLHPGSWQLPEGQVPRIPGSIASRTSIYKFHKSIVYKATVLHQLSPQNSEQRKQARPFVFQFFPERGLYAYFKISHLKVKLLIYRGSLSFSKEIREAVRHLSNSPACSKLPVSPWKKHLIVVTAA